MRSSFLFPVRASVEWRVSIGEDAGVGESGSVLREAREVLEGQAAGALEGAGGDQSGDLVQLAVTPAATAG